MKSKSSSKKTVAKLCPNCEQQVPVASKACSCGHIFRKASPANTPGPVPEVEKPVMRRRTERVRRERPEYFQSLEFITSPRTQSASTSSGDDPPKRKRGRPRRHKPKEEEAGTTSPAIEEVKGVKEEVNVFAGVSTEKALQYSIILAEINRKMVTQNFQPW